MGKEFRKEIGLEQKEAEKRKTEELRKARKAAAKAAKYQQIFLFNK